MIDLAIGAFILFVGATLAGSLIFMCFGMWIMMCKTIIDFFKG